MGVIVNQVCNCTFFQKNCLRLSFANLCHSAGLCQEPTLFTTSPALAIPKAIARAGIDEKQVDFYEINEAFAVSFFLWLIDRMVSLISNNFCGIYQLVRMFASNIVFY